MALHFEFGFWHQTLTIQQQQYENKNRNQSRPDSAEEAGRTIIDQFVRFQSARNALIRRQNRLSGFLVVAMRPLQSVLVRQTLLGEQFEEQLRVGEEQFKQVRFGTVLAVDLKLKEKKNKN